MLIRPWPVSLQRSAIVITVGSNSSPGSASGSNTGWVEPRGFRGFRGTLEDLRLRFVDCGSSTSSGVSLSSPVGVSCEDGVEGMVFLVRKLFLGFFAPPSFAASQTPRVVSSSSMTLVASSSITTEIGGSSSASKPAMGEASMGREIGRIEAHFIE